MAARTSLGRGRFAFVAALDVVVVGSDSVLRLARGAALDELPDEDADDPTDGGLEGLGADRFADAARLRVSWNDVETGCSVKLCKNQHDMHLM